jgi:hypothetical protein
MGDEIAYVPVPTQWLSHIYRRLSELAAEDGTPGGAATPTLPVAHLDDAMIGRIYEESHEPHRRLMRLMAEHPDEWRYSSEIATDLGLEHETRGLAGMFGAFGRRAKHRYGGQKPWLSQWDSAREENCYSMTADVAATVRSLAQTT